MEQWQAAYELNKTLPSSCRQVFSYPHLPTMLVTDPSEAIHSELIIPTMERYFKFILYKPIGGALAYLLLTHNAAIQKAPIKEVRKALKMIMDEDGKYTSNYPQSTMFAYWSSKPNKKSLINKNKLQLFQEEEDKREKLARKNKGQYYDLTLIQQLYRELDDLRVAKQHKQSTIEELQKENSKLERSPRNIGARGTQKITRVVTRARNKLRSS